jgi:hypothetical protein
MCIWAAVSVELVFVGKHTLAVRSKSTRKAAAQQPRLTDLKEHRQPQHAEREVLHQLPVLANIKMHA